MSTNQTLLEQLQITEFEIARRKELLNFDGNDVKMLTSCAELVRNHIDEIVDDFYETQTSVEEMALLIGDADTLKRLHSAQRGYILSLFDGYYDMDYVNNRLRIGVVHKRIGVEPKLYLSSVKTLKDTISGALRRLIQDQAHYALVYDALDKLMYFDTMLVFDTYIRGLLTEVESAKNKVVNYARELEVKVAERTSQLQDMARRDALTGLFNQGALRDYLRHELQLARRYRRSLTLVYIDVDDFKRINDSQGHLAGDLVLRALADAIQKSCRDVDFACRYGGDEFCVGLPECSAQDADLVVRRIRELFRERVDNVSLSIGVAHTGPEEFLESEALLSAADSMMYLAKATVNRH